MRFSVLGSGSKGNCLFIESGSTAILIDGGFSGKQIAARLARLDRDISDLNAIFVTHEHHDHILGVGVLSRRCRIPVYANEKTFRGGATRLDKLFKRGEFETGGTIVFKDFSIRSFAISHDAADPVGFVVGNGHCSLGICTDTGIGSRLISRRLESCDGLILEFNHDPDMLKNGPYPPALKQRVGSNQGHLSNGDGASLLQALLHDKLQRVVLAHLSETNNLPEIAYREAAAVLENRLDLARLEVSDQHMPTMLMELNRLPL
jgi:phosphoribosyl 1,2-cyclic phosphodiesterase